MFDVGQNAADIDDLFAGAFSAAVMFFYIFYMRVLADEKSVNTIVLGYLVTTVVDAASCNDRDVTAVSDIKIIVHHLGKLALT